MMQQLKECRYAARCTVCDKYTEWRLVTADFHVCPGECYRAIEESELIANIETLKAEGRLPADVECQLEPVLVKVT